MAVAHVQSAGVFHGTDALTFGANITASNCVVVFVSRFQADVIDGAVSGVLGNTYTRLIHLQRGGVSDERVAIFAALNVTGGAESITLNAAGNGTTVAAAEFSGVMTTAALDVTSSASGTGAPDSGTATGTTADAIAVGAFTQGNATAAFAPTGTGWTQVAEEEDNNTFQALGASYKLLTASGAQNATWSGSFDFAAVIAILKGAGGGGGTPQSSLLTLGVG